MNLGEIIALVTTVTLLVLVMRFPFSQPGSSSYHAAEAKFLLDLLSTYDRERGRPDPDHEKPRRKKKRNNARKLKPGNPSQNTKRTPG